MPKPRRTTVPLDESRAVKELLSILRANKSPSLKDFKALLHTVSEMEQQLTAAVQELTVLRRELAEAELRRHPAANAMRKAVVAIQAQVLELREKINVLKQAIIDGCKSAVAVFRENGSAALDQLARFFKIRSVLDAVCIQTRQATEAADRSIARIETVSIKYHEAGRRIKNAGRALSGKSSIQEAKQPGKVSKAFAVPFRAIRANFRFIEKGAASAAQRLERLEQTEKKKPSVVKTIRQYNQRIAQTKHVSAKKQPHAER
ncbi:MAG: hypothetical protein HFE65_08725 [Clostridiales bacterium]|nr:hypothetical protein [Clostridiales bacterium]